MSAGIPGGVHGSAFSGRVGWGDAPALVVVDLVRAYVEPDGPFWVGSAARSERALAVTGRLVAAARAGGRPVVWTRVRYAPDLADAGWFAAKVPALACFADGAPGGWGALALEPGPGDLHVEKQHASSFAGTALAATLRARGVDTVVVVGVSTSGCVRATATDALALGFRPVVVGDACADRGDDVHDRNLADLDAKYADVVDVASALAQLHPR